MRWVPHVLKSLKISKGKGGEGGDENGKQKLPFPPLSSPPPFSLRTRQRRHVQYELHRRPVRALQRDDGAHLHLVVGVDQDQVLCVQDANDVLGVAVVDGDAGVARAIDGKHVVKGEAGGRVQGEHPVHAGHDVADALVPDVEGAGQDFVVFASD